MKIHIIRGQNQIGGSIIEVSSSRARIILDVGAELDEKDPKPPHVEGLFSGTPGYDAVFISHYHGDHIGLLTDVVPEIPVYMGKMAYDIYRESHRYFNRLFRQIDDSCLFVNEKSIQIKDMTITPIACDHGAYDAYMFLIEADGKKILYTGDFRANGRMNYSAMLKKLSGVDVLITEGTCMSREDGQHETEEELQIRAETMMKEHSGPVFIMQAASNFSRRVTMFKAARHTGRIYLFDTYAAMLSTLTSKSLPNPITFNPRNLRVFLTDPREHAVLTRFDDHTIGRAAISSHPFALEVRSSMNGWIEKLADEMAEKAEDPEQPFKDGLFIYSMWNGYKERDLRIPKMIDLMKSKGAACADLHTSGHADAQALKQLIQKVSPAVIVPVHTENPGWFKTHCPERTFILDDSEVEV